MAHEPVRTPDEDSLQGVIAELEEELANLRAELRHEQSRTRAGLADARRARLRADELEMALQEKQEQFLDMLSRLQEREEQAVRRASELVARTREAEGARSRAEKAEARLRRVISEAGKLLGASLDYHATLTSVARLAAPELAEWCIIDVLDEHGQVERVTAVGPDADRDLARRLLEECKTSGDFGVHRVLRGGRRPAARVVDDQLLEAIGCGTELLSSLRGVAGRHALVLPLLVRAHFVGAMCLIAHAERPPYGEDDILLAQELARRAANTVDNARLYDAALAGSRAKSEFLAVMSHELRTPLSAIIGYSDLIRTGVSGEVNNTQEQQLSRIRASADHLLGLIEEILTFSHLEAGKMELDSEPLDAAEITRDTAEILRPLAQRKSLELTIRGADATIDLVADARKLRQILINLVSNALKFTDQGGVIVTLEAVRDRVRWRVQDTGIGIEPEHIEAIFTPFWQVEQSRTRKNEGSGLGLAVARGLAQAMGGTLEVESKAGEGSTFTLDLPAGGPPGRTRG